MNDKIAQKKIFIALGIIALLSINFILRSFLHRREATRVVQKVLILWKNGDLTEAITYWEDEEKSPPVYNLLSYSIKEKIFGKDNGIHNAQISAVLDFPSDNLFPSGKKWIFELNKTRGEWKIIDFRLADN